MSSLDYGCTAWRKSSQLAHNIYENGTKLWTKDDLVSIEEQLAQAQTLETFTVRAINGMEMTITNPMFGEKSPIWVPRVQYQDYWRLVKAQPETPPNTYLCSYLVKWINTTSRSFLGIVENPDFEKARRSWTESNSCKLLISQLELLLRDKNPTKVVCFGLGDMFRKAPEWMRRQMDSSELSDASLVHPRMIQHAIALTIAETCRRISGNEVQLLAQDPDYTEEAEMMLQSLGFSIVGRSGAGGFAEVDDNSVVFSVFVEAPLKQIIADIARPLLIIGTGYGVFNDSEKPWADAESPRTVEMWEGYTQFEFPNSPEEMEMMSNLRKIYCYGRKDM